MSKTMSTVTAALALLVLMALAACESESRRVREVVLPEPELSRLEDGLHTGEVRYRDGLYRLNVRIRDHRIVELQVVEGARDRRDREALAVLGRVVAEQRLNVDAVSGATRSSKLYLLAAYHALTGETLDY